MPKLNQIIALEKGVKSDSHEKITQIHHELQQDERVNGLVRTYVPRDDEGEKLPGETKKVQVRVFEQINAAITAWTRLFDITATKDWGNTKALADVVVDGNVLVHGAPVTYLLFLEKQLDDLKTFIKKLPTLSDSDTWTFDTAVDLYVSQVVETVRSKKVPRSFVKYEATKEHPAQTEYYQEDQPVGTWRTVKQSGALPASDVAAMLERLDKVTTAVKMAREQANGVEVSNIPVGEEFLHYIFD